MGKKGSYVFSVLVQRWCLFCSSLACFAACGHCQNQTCNPDDLKALQGFLGGLETGVTGWSLNTSFSDCCALSGVSCGNSGDSLGRVIGLELQNKNLKGSLSDSLGDLDHLQFLNLSLNSLGGTVPSRLLSLHRLEHLDLSMNDLSGSIPQDLYLPSIQVFNVSYNVLNGSHPILNGSRDLVVFDVGFNRLSGGIDAAICNSSTKIKILGFSMNNFKGNIPAGFGNCRSLEELAIDLNNMAGELPEDLFKLSSLRRLDLMANQLSGQLNLGLGNLSNLELLDLSFNSFSGNIPNVFGRLRGLEYLSLQSNNLNGRLPPSLASLPSLRVLNMRNNSLEGEINLNCSMMTHLSSLDLGKNYFSGPIPSSLSRCAELKTLNLARNSLNGEVPTSFRILTSLSYLSLSNNSLSNLSSALGILQYVSSLNVLVLTKNFHDGEAIPTEEIQGFGNLQLLAIASCGLSGPIPSWLANCSKLKVLDLSWNNLEGTIPSWLGSLNNLFYLDLSNNSLTGGIPENLVQMKALISGNLSDKETPSEDFPFYITRNGSGKGLQYNQVSSFPPSIILCYNMIVGPILPEFGNLKFLHVLDLSQNKLSGSIPDELSGMSSLETLDLSYNNLSGSIPLSLTSLSFLSKFSVAHNNLVGLIPTGGQFLTFSSSDFEGNPGLCNISSCPSGNSRRTVAHQRKNKGVILGMAIGIGLGTTFLLVIIFLFVSRIHYRWHEDRRKSVADSNSNLESAGSQLVLLFQNKVNNELTINDILKSTNHFDQANIIGCGGFGLVYKATLPDGRKVAIKRLSGDFGQMEREFQAEIETLSRAQHTNLVLLQGYCKIGSDRLLIYSYMENGSLDYWLHEKTDGGNQLDWKKRLRIAQGSARGLEYLHQACDPHILHRDIKSSNILLDGNFEPHLADFGLARLILPYDTHVTTDLVGTLGYIPPEYGQSSVATYKGDVYSFGVVLLELLTGKRPVDMCKPKGGRELISWVLQMKKEKREIDVFDPCIYDDPLHHQLMKMLEISCLCLSDCPKLRPGTKELVTWLNSIGIE